MRALVVLLLLANLAWLALAQGWLRPYVGLAAQQQREPQRLAAQVNADAVRVLSPAEAARAAQATQGAQAAQAAPPVPTDAASAPDASAPTR